MTLEQRSSGTIQRAFDDGSGLLLWGPPREDGGKEGFSLSDAYCTSPECTCRSVSIDVRPLEWPAGGGGVRRGERSLRANLDLDSGAVCPEPDATLDSPEESLLELVRRLLRGDALEVLRARWKRVKRMEDPDEWRHVDWDKIDLEWLVAYCEIFPSPWDLSVFADNQRYWVLDAWCLRPGCQCTDLTVEFLTDRGRSVGILRVDARNGRVIDPGGEALALRLWDVLMAEPGTRQSLADRREDVRRVARQLPGVVRPAARPATVTRVGRNEPCPCGSGKKYKRCCGR